MPNDPRILELSIRELFREGEYYIPLYQRNYAWTPVEVEQLLRDILDTMRDNPKRNYYLGSLVVDRRQEARFETVDGQQRHTTLGIILCALKSDYKVVLPGVDRINLAFDKRPASDETLTRLFGGVKDLAPGEEEWAMVSAYRTCQKFLHEHRQQVPAFAAYLFDHVKVVRTAVPSQTDLNQYFEVMNNRGEQLAKHEVLKGRLMKELGDPRLDAAFARIWDACADMGRHVQMAFAIDTRFALFGEDWNQIPSDLRAAAKVIDAEDGKKGLTLAEIIVGAGRGIGKDAEPAAPDDAGGVINFPNFLLQVLCVSTGKRIPLDDKQLLPVFLEQKPDPEKFIMVLLHCRMLLDRYVIRRETTGTWGIHTLRYSRSRNSVSRYDANSFNDSLQTQLTMLLAMFHVSFPTQTYKYWLCAALHYLHQATSGGAAAVIDGARYLQWLEHLSDRFLFGRFGQGGQVDFHTLCFAKDIKLAAALDPAQLHCGTRVQNFIFNRLDYLLWKRLRDKHPFPGVDMARVWPGFQKFLFTLRSSVEHHYPQNPVGHAKLAPSDLLPTGCDTFGNLCLISDSMNARLNNLVPEAKRSYFNSSVSVESLKQVFMFGYDEWGPGREHLIAEHERTMIDVLCERSKIAVLEPAVVN
jgi:hypothetical protein